MPKISRARAGARRRQIVEAALTCFSRRGFHKTTMQDVVEQSGLSPGSIYSHFTGKRDIIVAVVEERHRRERALLQRAFEKQSFAEAVDQLAADFVAALRAPEERAWRRLTVQLWAESLHDSRLAVAVRDGVESPKAILARMVQRAKIRGELPKTLDAQATARLLIAFFQGLVLQLTWDGNVDIQTCLTALKAFITPQRAGDRQGVGVGNRRASIRARLESRSSDS
jgi:AcrR family transcriptional regulator